MILTTESEPASASVFNPPQFPDMKNKRFPLLATLALAVSVAFTSLSASAAETPAKPASEKKAAAKGPTKPYPLAVCIVSDHDLGSMSDAQSMV